jgi:hypothetical protein
MDEWASRNAQGRLRCSVPFITITPSWRVADVQVTKPGTPQRESGFVPGERLGVGQSIVICGLLDNAVIATDGGLEVAATAPLR